MDHRNNTPDGLVRAYYCGLEKAQNLVDEHARVYAKVCVDCGWAEREMGDDGNPRCANHRCHSTWAFTLAPVPRGIVQCSPRPERVDAKAVALAPIGIAINGMLADGYWRFPMQALTALAVTAASQQEISEFARSHGWSGRRWTLGSTAKAIASARSELMRRLDAGI